MSRILYNFVKPNLCEKTHSFGSTGSALFCPKTVFSQILDCVCQKNVPIFKVVEKSGHSAKIPSLVNETETRMNGLQIQVNQIEIQFTINSEKPCACPKLFEHLEVTKKPPVF